MLQKITPFLWFDGQAEQAARFYVSIFKNSKLGRITRYSAAGPGPEGSVMTVSFQLEAMEFTALNGGPQFRFTPAISFVVNCQTQAEVDEMWEKLSAGALELECGWIKDKFGVSWQIVPRQLMELLEHATPAQTQNVMSAMFKMKKLDIEELRRAYGQG